MLIALLASYLMLLVAAGERPHGFIGDLLRVSHGDLSLQELSLLEGAVFDSQDAWVTPQQLHALRSRGVQEKPEMLRRRRSSSEERQTGGALAFEHHNYEALQAYLTAVATAYPQECQLFSVGQTTQGRELSGVHISDGQTEGEPELLYIGNMHGDEVVGRELLLHFIDSLLVTGRQNATLRRLVSDYSLWIIPTMNPDGYEAGPYRGNANGFDLNRGFPEGSAGDDLYGTSGRQPEVQSMMAFLLEHNFVLTANFHGGDVVANYPWDSGRSGQYNACPDDETFKSLALAYSSLNPTMFANQRFPQGITNGAAWYVLNGGMQDWHYRTRNALHITLEVSYVKNPPANTLQSYWEENRESMIYFWLQVDKAVHGQVLDWAGNPVAGANVSAAGIDSPAPARTDAAGHFWKILPPGGHYLVVEAEGHSATSVPVTAPSSVVTTVVLRREGQSLTPTAAPSTASPSSSPTTVAPTAQTAAPPTSASTTVVLPDNPTVLVAQTTAPADYTAAAAVIIGLALLLLVVVASVAIWRRKKDRRLNDSSAGLEMPNMEDSDLDLDLQDVEIDFD